MANIVRNVLHMKDITKAPIYSLGDKGRWEIDFEKIVPMAEDLNIEAGNMESAAIEYVIRECCGKVYLGRSYYTGEAIKARAKILDKAEEEIGREELIEKGLRYITNIARHGYSTWHDWRIENWGTKWNAFDTEVIDKDTVKFSTATATPETILRKLSMQRPDTVLEITWASDDVWGEAGHATMTDGFAEAVAYDRCSQKALDAYDYCWADGGKALEKVDGLWHIKTEET